MNNFIFKTGTGFFFGSGCVKEYLASFLAGYGPNVLLVTDRAEPCAEAQDEVQHLLRRAGKQVVTCTVGPLCPRYEQVQQAARLCRANRVDLILGVGGSAVLDGCKAAALGAVCRGDLWENFGALQGVVDIPPLPVGFVSAHLETGAINGAAGMIHEGQCVWRDYPACDPQFALLDPACLRAFSVRQLSGEGFSAFAGALETYLLQSTGMGVPCRLLETLMAGMVRALDALRQGKRDKELLSDLMWSCALWGSRFFQLGRKAAFPPLPMREAALLTAEEDWEAYVRALAARLPALLRQTGENRPELPARLARYVWELPARAQTAAGCVAALEQLAGKLGLAPKQTASTA
nr:iron-containing alcohol dehydrogenase [uncultured Agathobaculum sp.]